MFIDSQVNDTKSLWMLIALPDKLTFVGSSSILRRSHIPSPRGAASLPLPLGTGHET